MMMNHSDEQSKKRNSRRDFAVTVMRLAALAGLGGLAGWLIGRGQVKSANHKCTNQGICSGCSRKSNCVLPQAVSRRQALKQERPS